MNLSGRNGLKGEFAALLALLGTKKLVPTIRSIDENGADVYLIDQETSEYARIQVKFAESSKNFYVYKDYLEQASAIFIVLVVPDDQKFMAFDMYILSGEDVKDKFELKKSKNKENISIPEQYSFSVSDFKNRAKKVDSQNDLEEIVSERLKKYKLSISTPEGIYRYSAYDDNQFEDTLQDTLEIRKLCAKNLDVLLEATRLHQTICQSLDLDEIREAAEQLRSRHSSNYRADKIENLLYRVLPQIDAKTRNEILAELNNFSKEEHPNKLVPKGTLKSEHLEILLPCPFFTHHTTDGGIASKLEEKK